MIESYTSFPSLQSPVTRATSRIISREMRHFPMINSSLLDNLTSLNFTTQRKTTTDHQKTDSSFFWKFRPYALTSSAGTNTNIYTSPSSRQKLLTHYEEDNQRAIREGVKILPSSKSSKLRTLQWNINNFCHNRHTHSTSDIIREGIIQTILDADADVLILNEYCSYVQDLKLLSFEKDIADLGYHVVECGTVDFPTALATRLEVKELREVRLSYDRSALVVQVRSNSGSRELVWVIGTHLNHFSGERRHNEMMVLMNKLKQTMGDDFGTNERIVLAGDLNQQRSHDYAQDGEWRKICSGMDFRHSCHDDGVANVLTDQGFTCAWDSTLPCYKSTLSRSILTNNDSAENNEGTTTIVTTNWETSHPPATHWSGTIVDYSYGCNVSPVAVSISPCGWSDHRMTVCDWTW